MIPLRGRDEGGWETPARAALHGRRVSRLRGRRAPFAYSTLCTSFSWPLFTIGSTTYTAAGSPVTRQPLRNFRDNVEQVYIPSPAAGATYTIKIRPAPAVSVSGGPSYPAALFISGAQTQPAPALEIAAIARTGANEITIGWPATIGTPYAIETSTDLATWTILSGHDSILATLDFVSRPVTTFSYQPYRYYRVRKLL